MAKKKHTQTCQNHPVIKIEFLHKGVNQIIKYSGISVVVFFTSKTRYADDIIAL